MKVTLPLIVRVKDKSELSNGPCEPYGGIEPPFDP